jgi:hypothetical protein
MDLPHKKMSADAAAQNLKVLINNVAWQTQKIAIVHRKKGGPHWVYMIVADPSSGMQYTYFMERLPMIKAWLALDMNALTDMHIQNLVLELDGCGCRILKVGVSYEADEEWIKMEISCVNGVKQIISIEKQSMINAYYALRLGVEDMIETVMDVAGSFLNNL